MGVAPVATITGWVNVSRKFADRQARLSAIELTVCRVVLDVVTCVLAVWVLWEGLLVVNAEEQAGEYHADWSSQPLEPYFAGFGATLLFLVCQHIYFCHRDSDPCKRTSVSA